MIKKLIVGIVLMMLICLGLIMFIFWRQNVESSAIKVGVLHSLTGTLGSSERNLVDVVLMAIDEINAKGGVMGRRIEPIVRDGKSDEHVFETEANNLIAKEKVVAIFGCWSSASRKRVKPIIEKAHSILFYPVQYEGLEDSPNIIYTGAAPNQSIIPAVTWAFNTIGKRFFIVGSDYIFPRACAEIIKFQAAMLKAEIVGELYIPLGSNDVEQSVKAIKAAQPDVIFNAINGSSNIPFFKQLRAARLTPEKVATISFSIAEPELVEIGDGLAGDYAVWNYFQSIDRLENRIFVRKFKERYGKNRVLSNNMECAYNNVYLWAHAVNDAKSTDIDQLMPALKKQVFDGPGSVIYLAENNHAWREVFIGKIRYDKQFDIVWSSDKVIHPEPYPPYQDKKAWESFLRHLYEGWGNRWAKPT